MVISDVVEAILLRLPADDLLRFKSVSNSWYSLISSPCFIKTYAKLNCKKEEDSNNTRKIAMITSYLKRGYTKGFAEWRSYDRWEMLGSCNGLVCLYKRSRPSDPQPRIFVTNPVTRVFRELQPPPPITKKISDQCFGFGYDSSSDDYKLVLAIYQQGKPHLHILSLKSNVWKLFGKLNYRFDDGVVSYFHPGIFFNGALHWFWNDPTRQQNILLVSFNLAKQEFTEIPQPHDPRYVWNLDYALGIFQGRLCIFPYYCEDDDDDSCDCPSSGTWVLKTYTPPYSYSWELIPKGRELKEHAIHYMLKDTTHYTITPPPTYYCDTNIHLSRDKEHIRSPMFVQTLVSPYLSKRSQRKNNKSRRSSANAPSVGGPSHTNNNITIANGSAEEEKKEIEEVYSDEEKDPIGYNFIVEDEEIAVVALDESLFD